MPACTCGFHLFRLQYSGRPGFYASSSGFLQLGSVQAYFVSRHCRSSRSFRSTDIVYRHYLPGHTLNISSARTCIVIVVVVDDRIVDHGSSVDDFHLGMVMAIRSVVAVYISVIDPAVRDEYPMTGGNIDVHIDGQARSKGCPAIVSSSGPPAHPSRCPLISGDPSPALIVIVKIPSAIVESGPAPIVIGNPGVSVFGHDPVSVGAVWVKIIIDRRKPDVAVSAVFDPVSIGSKRVVENLKGDTPEVFCLSRNR